jgi:hypothetical protein
MSHTFEEPGFLSRLLGVGHKHGVKLTATLQAAMLKAVYNSADVKPSSEDIYKASGAVDLRTSHLIAPYSERNHYANMAVTLEPIEISCGIFESEDFWPIVTNLADQWAATKNKKYMAKVGETVAKAFIASLKNMK